MPVRGATERCLAEAQATTSVFWRRVSAMFENFEKIVHPKFRPKNRKYIEKG